MNKIKFLTEVPTAYLNDLDPVIDGHFCIASECLKDEAYYEWYKANPPDMLDNGMFEEGHPLSVDALFTIASNVNPKLVWAPDQVGDMHGTIATSVEFLVKSLDAKAPWQVGFIPQGANPTEVACCYYKMAAILRQVYAKPLVGISFLNDRPKVLEEINSLGGLFHDTDLHFLGMYNLEEIKGWPKQVVSCDTIKPFKAAYYRHELHNCPRGLGKWNTNMELHMPDQTILMYRNLAVMHKALGR